MTLAQPQSTSIADPDRIIEALGRAHKNWPGGSRLQPGTTRPHNLVAAAGLSLIALVSRWPFRGAYLFNWDSVQFGLGVRHFDLSAHRPHPPGYPGYVLIGHLIEWMGVNLAIGLGTISAGFEALTVGMIYLMATQLWGRFAGVAAATLLLTSPLYWLYGETALTYGLDPGLALTGVWLMYNSEERPSLLPVAAAAIGIVGSIRPTTEFFLGVPLAWTIWHSRRTGGRRAIAAALGAWAATTAAWVVPLLVLSRGAGHFLSASLELTTRVSADSAVWRAGLAGLRTNLEAILAAFAWSVTLFLPLALGVALCSRCGWLPRRPVISRRISSLLWLTALPPLLVYAFVHIGQLAYVLLVVPLLLLVAGPVLDRLIRLAPAGRRQLCRTVVLGACVVAQMATFVMPRDALAKQVPERDAHVGALLHAISAYAAEDTVLLTDGDGLGSYQLMLYYEPSYPVLAVGRDVTGTAGELFANDGSAPEYDLSRFNKAGSLRVPPRHHGLVLDADVATMVADKQWLQPLAIGAREQIHVAQLNPDDPARAWQGMLYVRGMDCPCGKDFPPPRSRPPTRS